MQHAAANCGIRWHAAACFNRWCLFSGFRLAFAIRPYMGFPKCPGCTIAGSHPEEPHENKDSSLCLPRTRRNW